MARKQKTQKKHRGLWELYESSGGLKRKNKFCPKCGQGVFMAQHKDRYTCGRCGYMEKRESVEKEKTPKESNK